MTTANAKRRLGNSYCQCEEMAIRRLQEKGEQRRLETKQVFDRQGKQRQLELTFLNQLCSICNKFFDLFKIFLIVKPRWKG